AIKDNDHEASNNRVINILFPRLNVGRRSGRRWRWWRGQRRRRVSRWRVSGVPNGPANAGGLNNSGNDPSGAGNSAKVPTNPGTNSLGTANSSGSAGVAGGVSG